MWAPSSWISAIRFPADMKDPAVIYRLLELAAQDPPVLLSLADDATVEDIDTALRLIAADRAADPPAPSPEK